MNYLELTFKGVLQFYCNNREVKESNNRNRNTVLHPTLDAVVGMIGSALNISRDDAVGLAEIRNSIIECKYEKPAKRIKLITDFQTASFDKMFLVNGSVNSGENRIVKRITYISNACFHVYIGADDEILRKYHKAFLYPAHPIYFGKKGCLPTAPIVSDEFITISEKEVNEKNVRNCDDYQ